MRFSLATASISLQGGQLMTWQPRSALHPVVGITGRARLAAGKSLRGGIPVCWPWFGPHDRHPEWPSHGYARTATWDVVGTKLLDDGAVRLSLQLAADAAAQSPWRIPARLSIEMTVGRSLKVALTTANEGDQPLRIGEALHTYLHVGDVEQTEVLGLEDCDYVDKVQAGKRSRQQGALRFSGETDSVYLDTASDCVVVDHQLKRRIRIVKSGSQSTVVWNPWREKASRMEDVGADGWQTFLCVESANALDNCVTRPPQGVHTLCVDYSLEQT
jgi:D-hexose-6-phosphate mutarotase